MILRARCTVPALDGHPIWRNYFQFARDPMGTLDRAAREIGPMSLLHLAHERLVLINEPSLIRRVLVERADAYSRTHNFEAPWLRMILGEGLLTADADVWQRLRRASRPAFTKAGVARMTARIAKAASAVLESWDELVAHGEPVDLFPELVALTSAITYEAFFGLELPRAEALPLVRALFAGQEFVVRRIQRPLGLLARLPTAQNRELRRGTRVIDRLIALALERRLSRGSRGEAEADDMLGLLLASSRGEGHERLEAHELRDQLVTNFVAGPENTATAMTWTLYSLCRHPKIAREVRAEIENEQAERPLLRRVLSETLRLYPGAPYFDRRALTDDEVGGHSIPRGTIVMIAPYLLHRTARYWERPLVFDPERFASARAADNAAYIPFGLGPRRCIGEHFALSVLEAVVPMMLRRFEIARPQHEELEVAPLVNLRPRGGFVARVERRARAARDDVAPASREDVGWSRAAR